jgi:hypothetical protein
MKHGAERALLCRPALNLDMALDDLALDKIKDGKRNARRDRALDPVHREALVEAANQSLVAVNRGQRVHDSAVARRGDRVDLVYRGKSNGVW